MLSTVVISLNEEENLKRLLPILEFSDEVIVVDSGSTDRTEEIVRQYGRTFVYKKFEGYGEQKRFAVSLAKYDWILNLDADEVPDATLIKNIRQVISDNHSHSAYRLKIVDIFLKRPMLRWGGKCAQHVRLFRRSITNFSDATVHERVMYEGDMGELEGFVRHKSYRNLFHYFEKFNFYTTRAASQDRTRSSVLMIFIRMGYKFVDFYFVKGYVRNGYPGFVWSLLSSFYVGAKLIKSSEMASEKVYSEMISTGYL